MLTLVYLGTGAAVPAPDRDNTSLAIDDGEEVTLVDASGAPYRRLAAVGLSPQRLARVVLTHEHTDHVYGLPSLLHSLWYSGRREPLTIYALPDTWKAVDRLLEAFRPASWIDQFPLERQVIVPGDQPFLQARRLSLWAAAVRHSAPTAGLRVEGTGATIAYSSDTAPCEAVVALARGCDLLVHEATYLARHEAAATRAGHSTARQAGEIATRAGARRLGLVHFTPSAPGQLDVLRGEAAAVFSGSVDVPADLDHVEIG